MNNKNRVFLNKEYLDFLHRLPCAITGEASDRVHVHHAANKGMGSTQNDYTGMPLRFEKHIDGQGNHITESRLTFLLREDAQERVIFYLSLFLEYKAGRYDIDADESCNFYELRKMLRGQTGLSRNNT